MTRENRGIMSSSNSPSRKASIIEAERREALRQAREAQRQARAADTDPRLPRTPEPPRRVRYWAGGAGGTPIAESSEPKYTPADEGVQVGRRSREWHKAARPLRVVGYVRVSTASQGEHGYGLRAQQETIKQYCTARGYQLLTITSDVVSSQQTDDMHGRAVAIAAIESGVADALLVRALDRATRDQLDAAQLYRRAEHRKWRLMDCDNADSGDASQRLTADVRLAMAAEERRRISQRTREGLARAKAEGKHIGRPCNIPPVVIAEIVSMRVDDGLGAKAIATVLEDAGVPTPGGGKHWHYSTVRGVLKRELAAELEPGTEADPTPEERRYAQSRQEAFYMNCNRLNPQSAELRRQLDAKEAN